ncbi:MAG: DUF7305 domain-containing protein [Planctomycetota bacterium]|jgi:hypothetical protein
MLHFLRHNNNGTTLVITLAVISLLAIIGATFTSLVIFDLRNAPWQLRRNQGFYLAESGLDEGIVLLRDDVDWSDSGRGDGSATHHFTGVEGEWYRLYNNRTGTDVNQVNLGAGVYSVQLQNSPGSDGKEIEVSAEGTVEDIKRTLQMQIQLRGWAAFGDEGLSMAGHPVIDSYDSDIGLYEEQVPGENGNVGSNGNIELAGNCTLSGDATPGPDGEVTITSGQVTITGSTEPARERIYLPPFDITFSATKSLKRSGLQNYILTDGTYYFTTIDFSAQANLVANGDVIIYCEAAMFTAMAKITVNPNSSLKFYCSGDFIETGGGIINNGPTGAGGKPENFMLYSTGTNIKLAGKSSFYGAIYAPNAYIDMGGTHDYYGAVIGRQVNSVGTGKIHYDDALTDVIRTSTTTMWHEVF